MFFYAIVVKEKLEAELDGVVGVSDELAYIYTYKYNI